MTRITGTTRIAAALLIGSSVLVLSFARPAAAQIVPPERNGIDFSVAALSGAPVWSLGFSHVFTPALDIAAFYSYQSVGGTTAGLLDVGVRYHFPVIPPGADVWLSGGLANASSFSGFGSATGFSVGAGASLRLTPALAGYAAGSLIALSGTSNAVIDAGLMLQLAPRVSGQLGYVTFAGTGGPYLGINLSLP